jgi:hypothetical protein
MFTSAATGTVYESVDNEAARPRAQVKALAQRLSETDQRQGPRLGSPGRRWADQYQACAGVAQFTPRLALVPLPHTPFELLDNRPRAEIQEARRHEATHYALTAGLPISTAELFANWVLVGHLLDKSPLSVLWRAFQTECASRYVGAEL